MKNSNYKTGQLHTISQSNFKKEFKDTKCKKVIATWNGKVVAHFNFHPSCKGIPSELAFQTAEILIEKGLFGKGKKEVQNNPELYEALLISLASQVILNIIV